MEFTKKGREPGKLEKPERPEKWEKPEKQEGVTVDLYVKY